MSIVTFCNSSIEQTGKTMSIAAIATYMAIEHNYRILVISTTNREDAFRDCFWQEKKKRRNLGIFGPNANVAIENGVEGLARIVRSNKITPSIITNYTKVVFKDRLEILLGCKETPTDGLEIESMYPDIIKSANQYYDLVFIDLDNNVDDETKNTIIRDSDIVVINMSQKMKSINRYMELKDQDQTVNSLKSLLLIGRYDRSSKYNSKNMEIFDLTTPDEIDKLMKEARIVITHGGVGSILNALKYNKPVIAAARLSKYKEHTNDHQKQIIGEFVKDGYLIELDDFNKLDEVLKEASTFKPKKYKSNNKKFVNNITKYIENDNHISWYNRFRYVVNILFLVILIGIVILIVS